MDFWNEEAERAEMEECHPVSYTRLHKALQRSENLIEWDDGVMEELSR